MVTINRTFGTRRLRITNNDDDGVVFIADDENCVLQCGTNTTTKFIIDSGASEHMANDESLFCELHNLANPIVIDIAKNGKIIGSLMVNDMERKCTMTNVLFVEHLEYHLLSMSRLESVKCCVTLKNDIVHIRKNNFEVAVGRRVGKLYTLDLMNVRNESVNASVSSVIGSNSAKQSLRLWHHRLAHLNYSDVNI